MQTSGKYGQLADENAVKATMEALERNGMHAMLAEDHKFAREEVAKLIPPNAEVMTMTSVSLEESGIGTYLNESGTYDSVRKKLTQWDLDPMEKQRIWSVHQWVIGSVHALTQDGQAIIASATGSQLGSYAYGATNVIWVVSTQKIVRNLDEGMKRIREYVLPLENERAMKAYGVGSSINKLLIVNKESKPNRIHIILVKEQLGY